MSDGVICKWCREFKDGRNYAHDGENQGRESVTTNDFAKQIDSMIRENRRFAKTALSM